MIANIFTNTVEYNCDVVISALSDHCALSFSYEVYNYNIKENNNHSKKRLRLFTRNKVQTSALGRIGLLWYL